MATQKLTRVPSRAQFIRLVKAMRPCSEGLKALNKTHGNVRAILEAFSGSFKRYDTFRRSLGKVWDPSWPSSPVPVAEDKQILDGERYFAFRWLKVESNSKKTTDPVRMAARKKMQKIFKLLKISHSVEFV